MHKPKQGDLLIRLMTTVAVCAALLWMAGCNTHPSDEQIRQNAQQATERARIEARKAAAEAKVAAAEAARQARDIASGVKAGMRTGHHGHEVDLNAASRTDLETLPGINGPLARRIIRNRPYHSPGDLVSKHVLTQDQYDRISDRVVAQE